MFRLIYLVVIHTWFGAKEGYWKWVNERYKARKWLNARCVVCTLGFGENEGIYETAEGYKHRACHYTTPELGPRNKF